METKFNFKSSVCTSRKQSRSLLALGLKKETADMHHYRWSEGYWDIQACPPRGDSSSFIPAWSLHRLIEMCPDYIEENYFGVSAVDVSYYFGLCEGCIGYKFVREGGNIYDSIIDCIEWLIKEGHFNKEYLEERK